LILNLDPATLTVSEPRISSTPSSPSITNQPISPSNTAYLKSRDRGFQSLTDYSPPESPFTPSLSHLPPPSSPPQPLPSPKPGKATPPPIDPGVFRCVTSIRRLIDEAAELSVRAASGLSAAALGSMRGAGGNMSGFGNNSAWATANSLGLNPLGDNGVGGGGGGSGRNVAMSAMRVHRLRAMAVQKLAQAYKADEIASSVMVMQGGSVFDDVAEKVLKIGGSFFFSFLFPFRYGVEETYCVDPHDVDARYVHFFHEKIPSRCVEFIPSIPATIKTIFIFH
jgi:hypothetical protein